MSSRPAAGPRRWPRRLAVLLAFLVGAAGALVAAGGLDLPGTGRSAEGVSTGVPTAAATGTQDAGPANGDFEATPVADGVSALGSARDWAGGFAVTNPDGSMYSRMADAATLDTMRGPNVLTLFARQAVAAAQTTSVVAVPGVTYTLTVAVGARDRFGLLGGPFGGAVLTLQAGATPVRSRTLTLPPVRGGFGDVSLSWTAGQEQAGLHLGIRLGLVAGTGPKTSTDFDNVRLTVVGDGEPVTGLVVSAPAERQVLQRGGDGLALVPVEGRAAAGRVEVRLVPAAATAGSAAPAEAAGPDPGWQPVARTAPDGFAGGLPGVPAGWYRLEVRLLAADGAVLDRRQVERVAVGEVFLTAGQSNAANYGRTPQVPVSDKVSAPDLGYGGWQPAADPQPNATGPRGSPWPAFGDRLAADLGVPVGIVAVGYGGTSIGQWRPDGMLYPRLQQAMAALGPRGFRAVLWHQGESDAAACTPAVRYAAGLEALIAASRRDAGFPVPWGIATAATLPNAAPRCQQAVRDGQDRVRRSTPETFAGPDTDGFRAAGLTWDGVHLSEAGLQRHGAAWAAAVERWGEVPRPG